MPMGGAVVSKAMRRIEFFTRLGIERGNLRMTLRYTRSVLLIRQGVAYYLDWLVSLMALVVFFSFFFLKGVDVGNFVTSRGRRVQATHSLRQLFANQRVWV